MNSKTVSNPSFATQLREQIEYPDLGVISKVILKDNNCQYTLFCLASGTEISEHTSTRNATVHVLQGRGILTLEGREITLDPGIFVFMPAHAPHGLKAEENLAFLLTISEINH